MNITTRLLVPAVLVAMTYGGSMLLGGMPSKCNSPERSLEELPYTLDTPDGRWVGEPVPTDRELFDHTGAEEIVDRKFHRSADEVVLLHSAVYLGVDLGLPHQPKECYEGAGHRLVAEEDVEKDVPGEPPVLVRLLTADREGQRAYVLYWYQIGNHVVLDRDDVKGTAKTFRGKPAWPPRLKMMLHTNQPDRNLAVKQLQSAAIPLMAWAKTFR